ncbi:MAG: IS1380 family transposase [Planctomycetes bacterium]|nr:IS1380 family transposase [Planctomycetota bacterium]
MGEVQDTLFPLDFNRSIVIEDRPERLTADAGVLALRQIDHRLGLTDWLATQLTDPRNPDLITHPQVELLRTRLYLIAQGHRDGDDADRLGLDPAFRLAISQRRGTAPLDEPDAEHPDGQPHALASQPTLSRLLATLAGEGNRRVLRQSLLESAKRHLQARRKRAARNGDDPRRLRSGTLDIDSYVVVVHGHQPGATYNGHYQTVCYHPLAAQFAPTGDWLDMTLREGHVHTAHAATAFLFDLLARVEAELCQVSDVRGDAGFPEEELLAGLEARRKPYVFRLRNNAVLDRLIEPYLYRPPGRPPAEPRLWLYEFAYQAESWSRPRRVVGVVREVPGELFLESFFLVTSWMVAQKDAAALLEHYRQRGTFESHLGEFKDAFDPALSSSPRVKAHYRGRTPKKRYGTRDAFACNEALLVLHALAFNLANVGRAGLEHTTRSGWTIRSFREHLLKTPARVLLHARRAVVVINDLAAYYWQRLARFLATLAPQPIIARAP